MSAKAAWRWAWASALARTAATEPSGIRIDALDLLAGLALAHVRDSPVSQLLAHFHIPAGAVLSDSGMRSYQAQELMAAFRRTPAGKLPTLDTETRQALEYALSAMPPSTDGLITLSMLFGALLETTNPASMKIRDELHSRAVDVEPVLQSCRLHFDSRIPYLEYLRVHHPYRAPEIRLPSYLPDEPRSRRPTSQPSGELADLVGISAEVDAFAYLIASTALTPPLAVGVFGDWGSGKSYFLRSLQRRIDQLVSAPVEQPPFHRAIAQIEFNAWQYVEGNLWASLLEHLFRNLRPAGEDDDDLLEARRREYLTRITESTEEHRRAVKKRDELASAQQRVHAVVQHKIQERDTKLAKLDIARRGNPLRSWRASEELTTTLAEIRRRTGIDELGAQAGELQQTLASTGEALRRAGPVLGALRTGGWRYTLALIVVIGFGPLVSFLLSQLDVSAVSNVIGSGSAVLAGVTAYAARGTDVLTRTLGMISRAQATLNSELEQTRKEFNDRIQDAEAELASSERALDAARIAEQRVAASVAELEDELARLTPSSVLSEFVSNRFASEDYRRHLGVAALVRQDLERLSRLIQQHHDGGPTNAGMVDAAHAIDRVVLYIDDLDRCPTDVVIKVLQAVHLLLAFPLFVVVLAVDARWLEWSLREHYTQLNTDAATPSDYLEKIFQVPFWVRPLGVDPRRQMVRGLLTPNLATAEQADTAGDPGPGTESTDADLPEFIALVESFAITDSATQPWLEAAKLTVTGPELRVIDEVSSLISATPRAVKRFINVYLLVRSVGQRRGWPIPEQGQVAVLLAIATGLPELASELLPWVATAQAPTLASALPSTVTGEAAVSQAARLNDWLDEHPGWRDISLSVMIPWIDLILRFRFTRMQGGPRDH